MIPILFDSSSTTFTGNGIGRLVDAISCTVNEKRNDLYELEMTYPISGRYFSSIEVSSIIYAQPAPKKNPQPFRVFEISSPIDGKVSIYAEHISYQLNHIPVKAFTGTSVSDTLNKLRTKAVEDCPFTFDTDVTKTGRFEMDSPSSIKACMGGREGSIVDIYEGEWEYDNYEVTLHANRGDDKTNTVIISYGKNLTDLTQEQNIAETYTGIMPYYKDSESNITYLTSASGCSTAPVVYSENAANFPYHRTMVWEISSSDLNLEQSSTQIQRQMLRLTNDYITKNEIGVPKVSLEVSFVDLNKVLGYEGPTIPDLYLCDTVTVKYEKLGVSATAKVVEVSYDVLKETYSKVVIGDEKVTFADQVVSGGEAAASQMMKVSAIPDAEVIRIMRNGGTT